MHASASYINPMPCRRAQSAENIDMLSSSNYIFKVNDKFQLEVIILTYNIRSRTPNNHLNPNPTSPVPIAFIERDDLCGRQQQPGQNFLACGELACSLQCRTH